MNTTELLSQLGKFVIIKSGLRNIDPAHCKTISELIFKETKNYVSETTVKRFFGFAQTLHKFSLFTLNSFSQYIGYTDWEAFCKDKENEVSEVNDIWQDLKIKCQAITDISLIAKKNSSGVPFDATANRHFLYSDFDYFLNHHYQFTAVSAQPGHGKSILLAHMVEHFFYNEQAVYKNDIVLLINSGTIMEIIQNGLSLKDWFFKEFKFGGVSELIAYFSKNPKHCKGRFVLIIDGVDQYLSNNKYFQVFVDFLHSVKESNFVKIVIGLRVNNLVNLQPAISGSAFLTKAWYKGLFFNTEKNTSVPPLNNEEILFTLSKIEGRPIAEKELHPGLIKQFKTPFWLQFYFKLKKENNIPALDNHLLCFELINYFLENKIFLSKNSTEKIFILKEIGKEISLDNDCHKVAKENILSYINCYPEAYHELLYSGILIEEKRFSTSIPTEVIGFINDDIYTYFLFLLLTEKHQFIPTKAFYNEIFETYCNQPQLCEYILNWSVRFCINRNEIEALKYIFQLPFTNEEKNNAFDFICNVATFELGKPNANFNAQNIDVHFINIMVTGKLISKKYKDTIKLFSEKVFNEDVQMLLHVIECSICIIDLDKTGLYESMQTLKRNSNKLNNLFPINPYDLILFFYNILIKKPNNGKTLDEKIGKLASQVSKVVNLSNEDLSTTEIISYRLVLIVLFTSKNYNDCYNLIMSILKKYPKIFYLRSSIFPTFLLVVLAQTYLKLNQPKKAQRIIRFLDKKFEADNTYYTPYIKGSAILAKSNFLNYTGNYTAALNVIETGIELAKQHDFHILGISFRLIKIDVLKNINIEEQVSQAIKELLGFLTQNELTMPDFVNLNSSNFDHTFNILKSYRA